MEKRTQVSEVMVCFIPDFNEELMPGFDIPTPEEARNTYGMKARQVIERRHYRVTHLRWEEREYRYGFDGAMVERSREIERELIGVEVFRLSKVSGKWAWIH
ncbi:MAG: hypothetical protein JW892_17520 [Anaerolineae bacterium]|nr:hypothetical protein [Anaerolineae bacterium]